MQMPVGLYYDSKFVQGFQRQELIQWLSQLHPIWEYRYATSQTRKLLRPVYWLGNWQFACLNYYHPPKGLLNRCVVAEPFPPVLARLIANIEAMIHNHYPPRDVPRGWELNTCLINYYGSKLVDGKWTDVAR